MSEQQKLEVQPQLQHRLVDVCGIPEKKRLPLIFRTKRILPLVVFSPDIQQSKHPALSAMADEITIADLTTRLCSGKMAGVLQEIEPYIPFEILERHFKSKNFPCSESQEVYALLLLQLYNELNKAGNCDYEVERLYAACCAKEKCAAGEHALYGDPYDFVTLLKRLRQMRGENFENTGFVSPLHRCSIISFPALNALQEFAEDLWDFVEALPPSMRPDCLTYIAIAAETQKLVVSFDASKFTALRDVEFNTASIAIRDFLKDKADSVQPVIIVALVLLQRLVPESIFEKLEHETYRIKDGIKGNGTTNRLVEMLVVASKGDVSTEDFSKQFYDKCQNIFNVFERYVKLLLFHKRQVNGGTFPEPIESCAKGGHSTFGEAAVDDCYRCACRFLMERKTALTCGALVTLLNRNADQITPCRVQVLSAMDITDYDACQGQTLIQTLRAKERCEENIRLLLEKTISLRPNADTNNFVGLEVPIQNTTPEKVSTPEEAQRLGTTPRKDGEIQPEKPELKNPEATEIASAKICKSSLQHVDSSQVIANNTSRVISDHPTKLVELMSKVQQAASPQKRQECEDFAAQQLASLQDVKNALTNLLKDQPQPNQLAQLENDVRRDTKDFAQYLYNAVKYFFSIKKPATRQIQIQETPHENFRSQLKLLITTVKSLGIQDEYNQEATEAISTAVFQAILELQDKLVWENLLVQEKKDPNQMTKSELQRFRQRHWETALNCVQDLLDLVWQMFFELRCVARSEPLKKLCAMLIQPDFGPSTQFHFNIELWETFRTVDLWIAVWRRNMKQKDTTKDVDGKKEFSFIVPVSTDGMLMFALEQVLGVQNQSLKELLAQLNGIKNNTRRAGLQEKVRAIFTGICAKYAISQGWLSKEKEELCKPHLAELLKDVGDVDLADIGCIDLRSPKIPLQDSTPNWDYMELTVTYTDKKFTISFADIRQFKAPNRTYKPNLSIWRYLQINEQVSQFHKNKVYTKLRQAFLDYSVVFDENTRMAAHAEYASSARFDFAWKDFLNPLNPVMACPVYCRSMYESEPLSESDMKAELGRAYFLHPEKLWQCINPYNQAEFRSKFLKRLIGFSGQVMVPIAKATSSVMNIQLKHASFKLRGWPTADVAMRWKQMLARSNVSITDLEDWNDDADMFLVTRFLQHVGCINLHQLRKRPLNEIISAFIHALVLSGSSPAEFDFNGAKTSFQTVLVRVWGPILIRSEESRLYELFRVGEKDGMQVGNDLYTAFLEVLENAGDGNFDEKALGVIDLARELSLNDVSNTFTALPDQAEESVCICDGTSTDLHTAATAGCLRCTAKYFSEAGTVAATHAAEAESPGTVEARVPHGEKPVDTKAAGQAGRALVVKDAKTRGSLPEAASLELAARLVEAQRARCTCQEKSRSLAQAALFGCQKCIARFVVHDESFANLGKPPGEPGAAE